MKKLDKKILLTCGTGGVGKTSLAAALGLINAKSGKSVLVLTIDPARRLANALGLQDFTNEPNLVWTAKDGSNGKLDCMMLDAKWMFDKVIEKYSPDKETASTILNNPLYRQLSTIISGSQEYMAMEQLYEISVNHNYDLIILDTPPASNALDFFKAPEKMLRALTDSMVHFFLKPGLIAGRFGARLFAKGAEKIMQIFGKITGAEMMQEISNLLLSVSTLFNGFEDRAEHVKGMLSSDSCGIILVTIPETDRISDAKNFISEINKFNMKLSGIIVNRMPPHFDIENQNILVSKRLQKIMATNLEKCRCNYENASELVNEIKIKNARLIIINERDHEISNLADLNEIATELIF